LHEVLQRFDAALGQCDLTSAPKLIEDMLRMYVSARATPQFRMGFVTVLRRRAAESTSRAFTMYLRAVADCIEQSGQQSAEHCAEEPLHDLGAPQGEADTPHNSELLRFLRQLRGPTPVP